MATQPVKINIRYTSIIVSFFALTACTAQDDAIRLVKSGSLQSCPSATLEQMTESFLASPDWASGQAADGSTFVNVTGGIEVLNTPSTALLQFIVDKNQNSFHYNTLEINGKPTPKIMAIGLLAKMCDAAVNK